MSSRQEIVIAKAWRSELKLLIAVAISSIACVVLSHYFPGSILTSKLLSLDNDRAVFLSLPVFWLIPLTLALMATYDRYNVRYVLDERGIETREGRLSLNQKINRIRFEDIRSIEIKQSLFDRILGIGQLEIGTSGTGGIEICIEGVGAPREIQELIQNERDRRRDSHDAQNEPDIITDDEHVSERAEVAN